MNTHDDLTTRLRDQLHDQVDDWHHAPLTFESVHGRARTIRRNRRVAVAGVAAAAVAAIVLPLGLAGDPTGRSDVPPDITDTPTEAVAPTPKADGTFPLTVEADTGAVPETGYLVPGDQAYVTPAGRIDLPGRFFQLLPFGDGWVGQRLDDQGAGLEVAVLDADFDLVEATPAESGLVTNTEGTRVAWVEPTGQGATTVVNAPADGGEPIRTRAPARATVQGFLDDGFVGVSFERDDGTVGHAEAGENAFRESPALQGNGLPAYQDVRGISDVSGLVAGQTEFRGDSTCSQVRAAGDGALVAETCDFGLGPFSPDGTLLIGYASYSDLGSPVLAVLDATTLEPVVEFTADDGGEGARVMSAAWEDDRTVVAVVEQGAGRGRVQSVVRGDLDGRLTVVDERLEVNDMTINVFLPQALFGQN